MAGANIFAGILEGLGKALSAYGLGEIEQKNKLAQIGASDAFLKEWDVTHPAEIGPDRKPLPRVQPTWRDVMDYRQASSPYYTPAGGDHKVPANPRAPTADEIFQAASGRAKKALQSGQPIDPKDKLIIEKYKFGTQ